MKTQEYQKFSMKIEHITVCVNYLDFLRVAYLHNTLAEAFDHYIVVSDYKDKATEDFCKQHSITLVRTNHFYDRGAVFNKGLAINEGFKVLKYRDWVCHMDADTFVHRNFRKDIELYPLNKDWFYGTERVLLKTPQDLFLYRRGIADESFEIPEGFGYGWFQMFNWQSEVIQNTSYGEWYPSFPDCRQSDWMFRVKFGDFDGSHAKWKGRFDKLPFRSYNLGQHGVNHFGRVSEEFIT